MLRNLGKLKITPDIDQEYLVEKLALINTYIIRAEHNWYTNEIELIIYNKELPEVLQGCEIPYYYIQQNINEGCIPREQWSIRIR